MAPLLFLHTSITVTTSPWQTSYFSTRWGKIGLKDMQMLIMNFGRNMNYDSFPSFA